MTAVTVVIPAYNAAHLLPLVIPAAKAALGNGRLLVVDPGSDDSTAEVAEQLGAEVLRLGHRAGPAMARNRGVERVDTEVTLFIDSDCVAHPDVVERVERAFADDPNLVSLTGSYDDTPPEKNFFSQYMNLRHHFVHQGARTEGSSFWAGCGAVRTQAFRAIGGFDAEQFPMPMIEDIELGLRLSPHGNTRLDPKLHVTHLKHWTFWGVVTTDIFSRAIPWGRLILATGKMPNDLNLSWIQRINALAAPLTLLAPIGIPLLYFLERPEFAAPFVAPLAVSGWLNAKLFSFFRSRHGSWFALRATLFHLVHLSYSAATMAYLTLMHGLRPKKAKVAGIQSHPQP